MCISGKRIVIYVSWKCGLLSWKILSCSLVLGCNDAFDGRNYQWLILPCEHNGVIEEGTKVLRERPKR